MIHRNAKRGRAAGAVHGALQGGALMTAFTSSQGLALIAHAAALESRLSFMHFFDGFANPVERTAITS